MKYKEHRTLPSDLRALADFYERPESVALPSLNLNFNFYVTHYDWGYDEDDKYTSSPNHQKSLKKIKTIARAVGEFAKVWDNNDLRVVKRITDKCRLTFEVTREAVCTKRVVGVEKVPMYRTIEIPNAFEEKEIVEWDCTEALLK